MKKYLLTTLALLFFETTFSAVTISKIYPDQIHLNQPFIVTFSAPLPGLKPQDLFLVINDIPFTMYMPLSNYSGDNKTLVFRIRLAEAVSDKDAPMDYIDYLVNEKDELMSPVYFEPIRSLAISDKSNNIIASINSPSNVFKVEEARGWIALGGWLICIVFLFYSMHAIGADKEPVTTLPNKPLPVQPSLRMFVICFWTALVISMYIYIWIITKSRPVLTASTLYLLGISLTTAALGSLGNSKQKNIDNNKVNLSAENWFTKWIRKIIEWLMLLVSDGDGPQIYRFQNLVFTFIFGLTFIIFGIFHFKFFVFNGTQLAVMGISSAGYLTLKWINISPKLPSQK